MSVTAWRFSSSRTSSCKRMKAAQRQKSRVQPVLVEFDSPHQPGLRPVQKQTWDSVCMIQLVFCFFSVLYGIAFIRDSASDMSASDIDDLTINCIFIEIADVKGNIVKTYLLPQLHPRLVHPI
jgi:hypothetical protein